MNIIAAWHCCDRAAREFYPGYAKGPSFTVPPHEHAPSLKQWMDRHDFDGICLVDPYGMYPVGGEVVTNHRTRARSFSRSMMDVTGWAERRANDTLRRIADTGTPTFVFMGPPEGYHPGEYPETRMTRLAEYAVELSDLIALGVTPVIDTAGLMLCERAENPIVTLLRDPSFAPFVMVEGWGAGTPDHPGGVLLGLTEARRYAEQRQAPLLSCVSLWLQGPWQDQKAGIEWGRTMRITDAYLEPTVWPDEEWKSLFEQGGRADGA